jgi:hypothetical protein
VVFKWTSREPQRYLIGTTVLKHNNNNDDRISSTLKHNSGGKDNIKMDLKEIEWEGVGWVQLAHLLLSTYRCT